jgi:hypothetical protein
VFSVQTLGSIAGPPNRHLKLAALLSEEAFMLLHVRHIRRSLSAIR